MIRLIAVFLTAVVATACCGGPGWAAAPVIERFSSAGGHARNKSGPEDLMYVVEPGDTMTFSVQATGAETYRWEVNKSVQAETGPSFVWSVPKEDGTWEIHVTAVGPGGQADHEWVASTLSAAEAPEVFDYFSDFRVRAGTEKDPWNRPLPEWQSGSRFTPNKGFIAMKKDEGTWGGNIDSTIVHGTWRFRVRGYRPGSLRGSLPAVDGDDGEGNKVRWGNYPSDNVHWYHSMNCGFLPGIGGSVGSAWGWFDLSKEVPYGGPSHASVDDVSRWHLLTVIYSEDGWFRVWLGRDFVPCLADNLPYLRRAQTLHIAISGGELDCVELYRDKYIYPTWPKKSAVYRSYVDHWESGNPVYDRGIVVEGDNVKLSEIAEMAHDDSKFRYDAHTRTADCYTNLIIWSGSQLSIENEILRMHCSRDGEHRIRVKMAALIKIVNSRVTSGNDHYYLWAFSGTPVTETEWEEWVAKQRASGKRAGVEYHYFDGRVLIVGSTIDNCGNISLNAPLELIIRNSRFTNLVNADYGDCGQVIKGGASWHHGMFRMLRGKKAFLVYCALPIKQFLIENVLFSGKSGKRPAKIVFIGGEPIIAEQRLINTRFHNARLVVKRGITDETHGLNERLYVNSVVSLINSDRKDISLDLDTSEHAIDDIRQDDSYPGARKTEVLVKYFLDVKAVDRNMRPIPNATVLVSNEVDDLLYPSETPACMHREPAHAVNFAGFIAIEPVSGYNPLHFGGSGWHMRWVKAVMKPKYFIEALKQGKKERDYLHEVGMEMGNQRRDEKGQLTSFSKYCGYPRLNPKKGYSKRTLEYLNRYLKGRWHYTRPLDRQIVDFNYDYSGITYYNSEFLKSYKVLGWYGKEGGSEVRRESRGLAWYIYQYEYNIDKAGNVLSYVETRRDGEHKHHPVISKREVVTAALTGEDGHIPVPSDEKQALIITDYKLDRNNAKKSLTRTEFTYTIDVFANGMHKRVIHVNPGPHWYRLDPNRPSYTITVVVDKDGQAESENELRKKGLAGRPEK